MFKKPYSHFLLLFSTIMLFSSCNAKTKKVYELSMDYPNFGTINFYMTFVEESDSTFYAYSNPQAVYQLVPFYKKWYLQIFGKGKNPGAILQIPNGKISGNSFTGHVESYIGSFDFEAMIKDNKIKGNLTQNNGALPFTGKLVKNPKHIIDYVKLNQPFHDIITAKIYDPAILQRDDWKEFLGNMDSSLKKATDDLDVLITFYSYIKTLKTSHVYLTKMDVMKSLVSDTTSHVIFNKINDKVSTLKFKIFELKDTTQVKKILTKIDTPNLIIDIRDCPGGDFSSLLLASHFIKKAHDVGYFLGQKYYAKGNEGLPSKKYLNQQKPFVKGSLQDFFDVIDQKGILVGRAEPSAIHYDGKIFVLINKNTASAAEPFAYFMKNQNLGTLIGENTAGIMLSAKGFNIYKDWWLTLPVADYYTMGNKHLDQVGVAPEIETTSDDAMKKAMELINQ